MPEFWPVPLWRLLGGWTNEVELSHILGLGTPEEVADQARELIARGKTKMAAIGAIMRKQLQLMRGVLVSGVPYSHEYEKLPISH